MRRLALLVVLGYLLVTPSPASAATLRCGGQAVTVDLVQGEEPTSGDDVISGTPERDVIQAGDGNDIVCARGGNDVVRLGPGSDRGTGGGGADWLSGGPGSDDLDGGPGRDFQRGGPGFDTCELDGPPSPGCEVFFIVD